MRPIQHYLKTDALGKDNMIICEQINIFNKIGFFYWKNENESILIRLGKHDYTVAIFRIKPAKKTLAERLAHLPNHLEIIASLKNNTKL